MNKIYSATINGKITGFAGCNNKACAKNCARKNKQLALVIDHNNKDGNCSYFIDYKLLHLRSA